VYAAGCLLFEMLSGRPPYTGETHAEVFRAHMLAPIPQLAPLRPEMVVAPELQRLLERALAKAPDERFADAGEMLEAQLQVPRPPLRPKTHYPQNDAAQVAWGNSVQQRVTEKPKPASRWPLVAVLVTSVCTALALAYALLR
jgi:serine/threonine protein kinase